MAPAENKNLINLDQLKFNELQKEQSEEALNVEFAEEHISLIHSITASIANKSKLPPGVEEPDLVSWGIEGLYKAKKKFSDKSGSKFATYAYYRIRGEILDRIRKEWQYRNPNAYQKNREDFQEKLADILENALESGETVEASTVNKYAHQLISKIGVSYLLSLEAIQESFEPASSTETSERMSEEDNLWKAVKRLSEEEQKIIKLFYIDNLKQKEIAKELKWSNSKISRIHLKILEKLKRHLEKVLV
jgi:RNA polymerase sigma factor for flagellar operon FliA